MAKQNIALLTLTLAAAGALVANRFVKASGAQSGADENAIGVARSDAASGEKTPVDVLGTVQIEAGAAVAAGATLKSDASGRGITWASSGAKLAIALEAASGAGEVIEAYMIPNVA